MIDNKLTTFLILYETMNYRMTAEKLNMTQPAVTQQMQALAQEYGCTLFIYDRKKLFRTPEADKLAVHLRSMLYNEKKFKAALSQTAMPTLHIGATKTIGEFVLEDTMEHYLRTPTNTVVLTVDNTERLLHKLERQELDFALIEGGFDKEKYSYRLYSEELFVGICAKNHPFAGKQISLEEAFQHTVILRENGSGTRSILENVLGQFGYNISHFERYVVISNFTMLCNLVARGIGISFAYRCVSEKQGELAAFYLKDMPIRHEFNYVYLKDTVAEHFIDLFSAQPHDNIDSITS